LEEALERAGATHQKIDALVLRISSTNETLGREPEDEEVRHLRVQQNRLRAELMRVAEQIEDFRSRRAQVRGDVERLRVIAQRKALSREVEALAGAAEGSATEAARAEVDLVEFDSRARLLSKEVAAADNALSVAIELVSLRSS
jgi:stress response protein YsnF